MHTLHAVCVYECVCVWSCVAPLIVPCWSSTIQSVVKRNRLSSRTFSRPLSRGESLESLDRSRSSPYSTRQTFTIKQGESAFSYYAARSWNQLPEEIRCAKTLATFKSGLKTHLFSCAFVEWALCYVRTDCFILCIILFSLTVLNFILNQFLYHFKFPYFIIFNSLFLLLWMIILLSFM